MTAAANLYRPGNVNSSSEWLMTRIGEFGLMIRIGELQNYDFK